MTNKNRMKVWALVNAMVLASNGYGFAATQIESGPGNTLATGTTDVLNVYSNTAGSPQIVNIDGTLNVTSLTASTASTAGVSGSTAPQIWTTVPAGPAAVSSYWTVTETGETTATTAASGGGATVTKDGNVVLQGGSTTTTVTTVDYGFKTDIDSNPVSTTYGAATASATVTGTYNGTTFVAGTGVSAATTVDTAGGNLNMEGIITQGPINASTNLFEATGTFGQLRTNQTTGIVSLLGKANDSTPDDGNGLLINTTSGVVTVKSTAGVDVASQKITNLLTGTAATDAANVGQVSTAVSTEASTRASADVVLSTSISTEESTRASADVVLSTSISTEASTRASADVVLSSAISTEVTTRASADVVLSTAINTEASTRASADVVLTSAISTEVSVRSSLIHQEADGIHIGPDSLVYAEDYFEDDGDRLFTTDGDGLAVTETFWVKPAQDVGQTTVTEGEDATLPAIDNGDTTSTVYTQTGSVEVVTEASQGGGVEMDTQGNVTLSKADTSGSVANYLQVTKFLVDNATGLPIAGSEVMVGGYIDEDGNFVEIGELDEDGLLDLQGEDVSDAELAAITTVLEPDNSGANLMVEGNATILGQTTTNGINNSGAKITNVANGTAAGDAVNKGQLDAEATARANADAVLQDNIDEEAEIRAAADESLSQELHYLGDKVEDLDEEVNRVGAFSAAFSALVPNDRAAGNTQISLGLGNYGNETAGAIGVFHYVNDNILLNAGAASAFSGGNVATRAGVTIGF